MESFDIDTAAHTGHLVYNKEKRMVVAEVMDNNERLKEGKEEFSITRQGMEKNSTVKVHLWGAREGLEEALHERNGISNVDRDTHSRVTNHVSGATVGNSTQQSTDPVEMARNHKEAPSRIRH